MTTIHSIGVTWLGQAGFIIEIGDLVIVIDPFLSDHHLRAYPPDSSYADVLGRCDAVLATHSHIDHLDRALLDTPAMSGGSCPLIVPDPLAAELRQSAPTVNIIGATVGQPISLSDTVQINSVVAAHGDTVAGGYVMDVRDQQSACYLGYVISSGAFRFYHAGDTLVTDNVVQSLTELRPTIAAIPINGRNYYREKAGNVGNMDFREAAQFASDIGAEIVIPMHWDMFVGNTELPSRFVDEAQALNFPFTMLILSRGRTLSIGVRGL